MATPTLLVRRLKSFYHKKDSSTRESDTTSLFSSINLCPVTPDSKAEYFIGKITSIYSQLSQLTDLRPSAITNSLFGDLVGTCITIISKESSDAVLQDPRVSSILPALRSICSAAEAKLEGHWAELIASMETCGDANRVLSTFPYHMNYENLTRLELAAIASTGLQLSSISKIAFIGSGPMPLTSLHLLSQLSPHSVPTSSKSLQPPDSVTYLSPPPTPSNDSPTDHSVTITNIDMSALANQQARGLCDALGGHLLTGMRFVTTSAGSDDTDLSEFDVVWLAALVGAGQAEKEQIVTQVVEKMKKGSLLVLRGAWGLRSVLYCDFDATTPAVSKCLDICVRMDPFSEVVNSVIVGRVK